MNKELKPVKREESFTDGLVDEAAPIIPGLGMLGLQSLNTAKLSEKASAKVYISIPENTQFGPAVFLGDGGTMSLPDPADEKVMRDVQTWLFEAPGNKRIKLRVCGFTTLDNDLKTRGVGEVLTIQRYPLARSKKNRMFTPVIVFSDEG